MTPSPRGQTGRGGRRIGRLLAGAVCATPLIALAAATWSADPAPTDDAPWEWRLPPGFVPPVVPADNPMTVAKVELGRRLFYDTRLSGTGAFACATCHEQERAFTDGRARAVGETGQVHPRSSMSLANAAYPTTLGWADPRLVSLEIQARVPLLNVAPVEMGMAGREEEILDRFRSDPDARARFARAFPGDTDPIDLDNVTRALASFVRTLVSGDAPWDRWVFEADRDAVSVEARAGARLFFSERLSCGECHAGFTFSGPIVFEAAEEIEPTFHNTGLQRSGDPEHPGLAEHTGRAEDHGLYRAPTLRNIAVTAPYMHDGSVRTLDEVLDFYAAGGRDVGRGHPNKSERIAGFELTAEERTQLLAFLHALTDEGFLTDPRYSDPSDTEERRPPASRPSARLLP